MVQEGSVVRSAQDLGVTFVLTDHQGADFAVQYTGILPDLFREGQGILVEGQLNAAGVFNATEVLAKHDENYMPPELMDLQGMEPPAAPKAGMPGYPSAQGNAVMPPDSMYDS
jgi:cytochrome c-type biogenesis protein CcmE